MSNERLYERALEAIRDLFDDTSVSVQEAKDNLNGLLDEIQVMLESLG